MGAESRLLVVEMMVPPGNGSSIAKLLDLEMLVTTGGRERTDPEFCQLFDSAGLRLSNAIPIQNGTYVLECIPRW